VTPGFGSRRAIANRLYRQTCSIVRPPEQKLQTREEMEVVFTLLAERYERGSVLLTSNLPFSKWEGIF
jgi:hypothetical protein